MMRFAAEAVKHFPKAEIVEMHHDKKADAPSGTAVKTAQMMAEVSSKDQRKPEVAEKEMIAGSRGGNLENIHIHSVRLPGLFAHQEVIFGGLGQTLTIRHDTFGRECYMPGVVMAVRKVMGLKDLVYGLEKLL
jgi:4-hydroxy-tetrahydrodipicolinate reductase